MSIGKIGFIGLGAMGYPIACHLLEKGFELHIGNHSDKEKSKTKVKDLESKGAKNKGSINNIPIGVDIIISILPTDKEIREVYINDEFYKNVERGTKIVDMTSSLPESIFEVEEYYKNKDVKVIDAPVSGGVKGAQDGSLTIFGSGDEEEFKKLKNIFESFSHNIYYIGKLGDGKVLKSINQMMIAINTMGVIEAFTVAKNQEINFDIMKEVISKSSGNSYAFNRYLNLLENNQFEGGFKLSLMRKDIKTALDLIDEIPLPFTNLIYNLFLMGKEYDDMNYISISELYK